VVAYFGMKLWLFWTVPAGIESAQGLPSMSLATTLKNLAALFSFDVIQVFDAYPIYFRVSTCILLGWFALAVIFARSAVTHEAASYSLFLLSAPMATQAMYYIVDGYRDFRVLLGFHALAGLAFLSRVELPTVDGRRWLKMMVASAVAAAMAINFQLTFRGARSRYDFETQHAEGRETDRTARFWFDTMANSMQFVPEETSFCKTVYGSLNVSGDPRIIHMPYGFASSAVLPVTPDRLPPLKGKYALLHYTPSPLKELFDASPDWRMLGQFGRFVLYRSTVNCLSEARHPQGN